MPVLVRTAHVDRAAGQDGDRDADRRLAARLRAGDAAAFETIYQQHCGAVFATALRMLQDRELASDVAQEVFVTLWERPDHYCPDRGALRTFLVVMSRRRAIDVVRSRSAASRRDERHGLQEVPGAGPEEVVADRLHAQALHAAVRQLPDPQRRAVELAYFGGLNQRQVAARLNIPEGTAKSRLRLALARLRGILHQQEGVSWI